MNYVEQYEKLISQIGCQPMKAIKAMCFQCSGYSYKEARLCKNSNCPLYILKQNRLKNKD